MIELLVFLAVVVALLILKRTRGASVLRSWALAHPAPHGLIGGMIATFNDLRHAHAALALTAGVHPTFVQERLGRSSISISLDLYSPVVPGMQREAAGKVAMAVFGQASDSGAVIRG